MTNGQLIRLLSEMIFTTSDIGSSKINSWLNNTIYHDNFLKEYIYLKAYIAYILCREASISDDDTTDFILTQTYSELNKLFQNDIAGYGCTYAEMMERIDSYVSSVDPQNPNTICREFLNHIDDNLLTTDNILYIADLVAETRQNMHNELIFNTGQQPQSITTPTQTPSSTDWKSSLWIFLIMFFISIPVKIFLKTTIGSSSLGIFCWVILAILSYFIYNYFSNRRSKSSPTTPEPKKEDAQPQGKAKLYAAIGLVCIIAFTLASNNDNPKQTPSTTTQTQQPTKTPSTTTKPVKPAPPPKPPAPVITTETVYIKNIHSKSDVNTFPIQVTQKDGQDISYLHMDTDYGYELYIDYKRPAYGFFQQDPSYFVKAVAFEYASFLIGINSVINDDAKPNRYLVWNQKRAYIVNNGGRIIRVNERGNSLEIYSIQNNIEYRETLYVFPQKIITLLLAYKGNDKTIANSVYEKARERLKIY